MKSLTKRSEPYELHKHPWIALAAIILTSILSMIISSKLIFGLIGLSDSSPLGNFSQSMLFHILTVFVFAPFILRLPKGKTNYAQYLQNIGLRGTQPFLKLIVLGLTCYVFLFMSQAASSLVYRIFEGLPINYEFLSQVFDLSGDLPPVSANLFTTIPSMLEEVGFRGIVLTVFLDKYPKNKSIIFSSIGFGLMHMMNLLNGRELVWVLGQVIWASIIGLFYGYVFVRTKSLLPSMIVHYFSNLFVGSLAGYMQSRATPTIWALYGVLFSFGVIPTVLMLIWARYFISKWINQNNNEEIIN